MDIRRVQHFSSITNDEQKAEINRLDPLNKMKAKLI